jgi:hypothetical protein
VIQHHRLHRTRVTATFARWFAPNDFDANVRQRERLSALTAATLERDRAGQAE